MSPSRIDPYCNSIVPLIRNELPLFLEPACSTAAAAAVTKNFKVKPEGVVVSKSRSFRAILCDSSSEDLPPKQTVELIPPTAISGMQSSQTHSLKLKYCAIFSNCWTAMYLVCKVDAIKPTIHSYSSQPFSHDPGRKHAPVTTPAKI